MVELALACARGRTRKACGVACKKYNNHVCDPEMVFVGDFLQKKRKFARITKRISREGKRIYV